MIPRASAPTAIASAAAAFAIALLLGTERIQKEISKHQGASLLVYLRVPDWGRAAKFAFGTGGRYLFLLLFPVLVFLLVWASVRGANGLVTGWTATVAAAAICAFTQGLTSNSLTRAPGQSSLDVALMHAGRGAVFGFLVGWVIAIIGLIGGLHARRPGGPVYDANSPRPIGTWAHGPAEPGYGMGARPPTTEDLGDRTRVLPPPPVPLDDDRSDSGNLDRPHDADATRIDPSA